MTPERMPGQSSPWEQERSLRDYNLSAFQNSAAHEAIDSDNPTFVDLYNKAKRSMDNLAIFPEDTEHIFVRISINNLSPEEVSILLEDEGFGDSAYIGYGTGNGNVGFTTTATVLEKIASSTIVHSPELSLFLPYPTPAE